MTLIYELICPGLCASNILVLLSRNEQGYDKPDMAEDSKKIRKVVTTERENCDTTSLYTPETVPFLECVILPGGSPLTCRGLYFVLRELGACGVAPEWVEKEKFRY